jgi:hypothetical protein
MVNKLEMAFGVIMSSLRIKGCTKSWEAHDHDLQFGKKEIKEFGKSPRLRKEYNARINILSAMRPGLAKIIEKVCIAGDFETPESAINIAENACPIHYADSWLSKHVH